MDKPAPLRFEVEKAPVPGTAGRHTVVLKDHATEVPADLGPIVVLLRALPLGDLSREDVNERIDEFMGEPEAPADEKSSSKHRMARMRSRDKHAIWPNRRPKANGVAPSGSDRKNPTMWWRRSDPLRQ